MTQSAAASRQGAAGRSRRRFLAASVAAVAAPAIVRAAEPLGDAVIGQMLMLGFQGADAASSSARSLAAHLEAGRVGGVCFLGYNARSRAGLEGLTQLFGAAGAARHALIAIDHEGGAVQRLGPKLGYPFVPSARDVAARFDPMKAAVLYQALAVEMRQAGFNFNLAPVVDLGFQPLNPPVSKWGRAFAPDGATVARYAAAFISGHRAAGVATAAKHFPGHGSTLTDSHERTVDITATWRADELTPYRALAKAGLLDAVMTGHLAHARLTGGEPATLSRKAVQGLLRDDIGHRGVVVTDDLDMAAIRKDFSLSEAVVRAVAAGSDIILLSNSLHPDPDLPVAAIGWIREAIATGRIRRDQVEASAQRLAMLKSRLSPLVRR